MSFVKGREKTGGRVKGVTNRSTLRMREAIIEAFDKAGGVDYLVKVSVSDPKTFLNFVRSIIPAEIHAEVKSAVDHTISVATFYEAAPDEAITHVVIEPIVPAIEAIALERAREADEAFEVERMSLESLTSPDEASNPSQSPSRPE